LKPSSLDIRFFGEIYQHIFIETSVDLTALIVNYNTAHLLEKCVGDLRASALVLDMQICVLDNASRDDSVGVLQTKFSDCVIKLNSINVGFGRANNQLLDEAKGKYILLLNTDAFVASDSLAKTVAYMNETPECGVLGVRLVGRDGELQPSCRYFPTPWNVFLSRVGLERFFPSTRSIDDMKWGHDAVRECDWVPGCYYLVRREVIEQVGLFDPRFFLYYEEVDHCRAVKSAGWKVVFYPHTTVIHVGGESAKSDSKLTEAGRQISDLQIESELLYFRKHHGLLGVWLSVVLMALADILLSVKWLLRMRTLTGLVTFWNDFSLRCALLVRTAWATKPTR
jgi:N-acetylglucosaminyl-diphospho-decaprenol L-rhamnosyltransferase